MSAKRKSLVLISFFMLVLTVTAVSCTNTNPPVDTTTGATKTH